MYARGDSSRVIAAVCHTVRSDSFGSNHSPFSSVLLCAHDLAFMQLKFNSLSLYTNNMAVGVRGYNTRDGDGTKIRMAVRYRRR